MPYFKIIHFHTFKNGGSTLDWILKRNFGNQFGEFHGPTAQDSLLEADILEYLDKFPEITALSSHHFRFPIHSIVGDFELLPVSLLRHPIDRIYSVYAHEQRVNTFDGGASVEFKEWLKLCINERPYTVRDVQTNLYADGGTYYEVPDIGTFKRACSFIDSLEYCGIVEKYDSSMVWLEEILSKYGFNFDGAYRRQNINPERMHSLQERVDDIKSGLGDPLYEQLLMNNLYDLDLYEYALQKMQIKTSMIVDLDEKISALQKRSLELRS
jgi:hypothetical protein